ncbi:hypothetical protein THAOC_32057, partial [Thalassiosira oceanica]
RSHKIEALERSHNNEIEALKRNATEEQEAHAEAAREDAARIDALSRELKSRNTELDTLNNEVKIRNNELEALKRSSNNELEALERSHNNKIESLKSEIEALKQDATEEKESYSNAMVQNKACTDTLNNEIHTLNDKIDVLENKIKALEQNVAEKEKDCRTTDNIAQTKMDECRQMKYSLHKLSSGGKLHAIARVDMIASAVPDSVDVGDLARLTLCEAPHDDAITLIRETKVGRIRLKQNKFVTDLLSLQNSNMFRLQCKFQKRRRKNGKREWDIGVTIESYVGDTTKEDLDRLATTEETRMGLDRLE